MKDLDKKLEAVNRFWFEELSPKDWWIKSNSVDLEIKKRFEDLHHLGKTGALEAARTNSENRLAEIIILDQFSRNIYRDKPDSFACDTLALKLAQEAVANQDDLKLSKQKRQFIYMPFMHSESLDAHDHAVKLFEALGAEDAIKFEHAHRDIIVRFGRYPHRNKILGRLSTEEELNFLEQPGSSF